MPEQDVREKLQILGFPVHSVMRLGSLRRDPKPSKDSFPLTAFHSDGCSRAHCQEGAQFDVSMWSRSDS